MKVDILMDLKEHCLPMSHKTFLLVNTRVFSFKFNNALLCVP